jgi:hypothetical protein
MNKKSDDVHTLTNQLISQLTYCNSRIPTEELEKVAKEMLSLICTYRKRVRNLSK